MKASGNALGAQAAGERGWPDVEPYGADAVWEAILRRAEQEDNADDGPADIDFKGPEWQAFTRSGSIDLPGFTARKEPPPAKPRSTDAFSGLSVFKQVSALIGAVGGCTW